MALPGAPLLDAEDHLPFFHIIGSSQAVSFSDGLIGTCPVVVAPEAAKSAATTSAHQHPDASQDVPTHVDGARSVHQEAAPTMLGCFSRLSALNLP